MQGTLLDGNSASGLARTIAKLKAVADRFKIPNILNQQPTQYAFFDSVDLNTFSAAGPNNPVFFNNTGAKTALLSNYPGQGLTAGQIFAIENICFYIVTVASGIITKIEPIESSTYDALLAGTFSMSLAGSEVIRNYPLSAQYAPFNANAKSVCISVETTPATIITGSANISLDSTPVLLPNVTMQVNTSFPGITPPAVNTKYLFCMPAGFGTLPAVARV